MDFIIKITPRAVVANYFKRKSSKKLIRTKVFRITNQQIFKIIIINEKNYLRFRAIIY